MSVRPPPRPSASVGAAMNHGATAATGRRGDGAPGARRRPPRRVGPGAAELAGGGAPCRRARLRRRRDRRPPHRRRPTRRRPRRHGWAGARCAGWTHARCRRGWRPARRRCWPTCSTRRPRAGCSSTWSSKRTATCRRRWRSSPRTCRPARTWSPPFGPGCWRRSSATAPRPAPVCWWRPGAAAGGAPGLRRDRRRLPGSRMSAWSRTGIVEWAAGHGLAVWLWTVNDDRALRALSATRTSSRPHHRRARPRAGVFTWC